MSRLRTQLGPAVTNLADTLPGRLASAGADVVLALDRDGVIREVSLGADFADHPGWQALEGMLWRDTLRSDSQPKVEPLLREAQAGSTVRAREVNQVVAGVGEIPLRMTGVALDNGWTVLLGQDLRPVAELQQRAIVEQQAMDQHYAQQRQENARYRALYHTSADGVVVAEGPRWRALEANPSAAALLDLAPHEVAGQPLEAFFAPECAGQLLGLVATAEVGAGAEAELRPRHGRWSLRVAVSLVRVAGSTQLVMHICPRDRAAVPSSRMARIQEAFEALPDGYALTDAAFDVVDANESFCTLVGATRDDVLGEPLSRWVGRPAVDVVTLRASLQLHGQLRNFGTVVRPEKGDSASVVVTAVAQGDGYLFCLYPPTESSPVPSVGRLRELVGRISLKDIVRSSREMVEDLCIDAALEMSDDNRARAAEILGMSRQSLYAKLRRNDA